MEYHNPLALLLAASLVGGCASMQSAINPEPLHSKMTDQDVLLANQTLDSALQTKKRGVGISWTNAANGHSGMVTPTKTYRRDDGRYCRDYLETFTISAQSQQWRDTACRADDGRWLPLR